jgi:6,7-dimethyl-8-ribityllumazine synthase
MKGLTPTDLPAHVNPKWTIGIVASTYHKEHIDAMVKGASELFIAAGIPESNVQVFHSPGSFEIPVIGRALVGKVDALIGFGIIVEGATHHARLLAESTTNAMMQIQIEHALPFAFEILYVNKLEDAIERTQGNLNKGIEAARAVLHTLAELQRIQKL